MELLEGGQGAETVLLLHGGTGSAESIFRYFATFEKRYRVLAPTVPTEVVDVRSALEGIRAILAIEGVEHTHCIGFSMGGMLAQVMLREHPEQVRSITLFHCPPPSPSYAALIERRQRWADWMPAWVSRYLIRRYLEREFSEYGANEDDQRFWVEYYLQNSTRKRTRRRLKIVLDYLRKYSFTSSDLTTWRGDVLIIETATDKVIPEAQRTELRVLYPQAAVHTFPQGGHLGNAIFMFQQSVSVMTEFLRRQAE